MADTAAYVKEAILGGIKVKLYDNGDGTHAFGMAPAGATALNITGAGTTLVKSGPGTLIGVIINKAIASSVTAIYDSVTASGTKIATITNPLTLLQQNSHFPYNANFANGLTITTSAGDDITVLYR